MIVKRTKPRRQSGDAVKDVEPGNCQVKLQEFLLENSDRQDSQRMRQPQDQMMEGGHDSATMERVDSFYISYEEEADEKAEKQDKIDHHQRNHRVYITSSGKRTKPRHQSGEAVAHLWHNTRKSIEYALADSKIELHNRETYLPKKKRHAKKKSTNRTASE